MSVSKLPDEFRTVKELGRGLHEVHRCVDAVGKKVDGVKALLDEAKVALAKEVAEARRATQELADRLAEKEHADGLKEAYRAGALEAIGKTVGAPLPARPGEVDPPKAHRRILGVKVWQFWTGVFGALAGVQLALKVIDRIPWPSIWHAIISAH